MAVTLEELQIRFTAQMGGLTTQLNGVKKQLGGVTASASKASTAMSGLAKMAKLFVGVYLVRGMVKIGKESLKMANDVVESEQLFGVSMKGMANDAREWSDELSASLGLNAYGLRKNVGIFNTMFTSMGLSTDKAYEMSTGLVELAEDMASFYNMDSEEAFTKLRAGITGETEPLKRLGIMVDENTTKQYALSEGISQTGKDMSQTEKLMARYAAIMGQTADAQGDLARTINSPVNQIRILGNTLDMAKISLGQAFQPIQAIVLPLLNSLAQAALSVANALKTFMWALTGFTGIGANAGAIAGAGADANEDLTDSLNDSAKAYKAAGGAAKQASKDAKVGLKAFDEINKITEESEKSGGGGGGLAEIPEISKNEQYAAALDKVNEAMSKAADWLKKVWDLALPTREAMSRLWDSLSNFGSIVWDSLVDIYEKFIKPIGEWTITQALPTFLDTLAAGVDLVSTAVEAAKPWWETFYNNVLVPIGNWAGGKIISALNWLKGALDSVTEWIKNNPETFSKIVGGIAAVGLAIAGMAAFNSTINTIKGAFKLLGTAISALTTPKGAITLLIAALVWVALNWDDVKKFALDAWEKIKEAWGKAGTWIYEKVILPVAQFFTSLWSGISPIASNAWTFIKGVWQSASQWIYEKVILPVATFFGALWTGITTAASNAQEAVQQAWNGISGWFNENIINPIRSAWDDLMAFLGVKKTVNVEYVVTTTPGHRGGSLDPLVTPSTFIPKTGTNTISDRVTSNKSSIQKFATGGVFQPNKPFLGILGDQKHGRNIEAPERVLRDIFRDEMGSTPLAISAMRTPSYGSLDATDGGAGIIQRAIEGVLDRLNFYFSVDGETFGRVSARTINEAQRSAGRLLLEM